MYSLSCAEHTLMLGTNRPPFVDTRPFGLPADSVEITLDLPMPPSTNRLWRSATIRATRKTRYYKSPEYLGWCEQADITVMAAKQYPKRKILGAFEFQIMLSTAGCAGCSRTAGRLISCSRPAISRN